MGSTSAALGSIQGAGAGGGASLAPVYTLSGFGDSRALGTLSLQTLGRAYDDISGNLAQLQAADIAENTNKNLQANIKSAAPTNDFSQVSLNALNEINLLLGLDSVEGPSSFANRPNLIQENTYQSGGKARSVWVEDIVKQLNDAGITDDYGKPFYRPFYWSSPTSNIPAKDENRIKAAYKRDTKGKNTNINDIARAATQRLGLNIVSSASQNPNYDIGPPKFGIVEPITKVSINSDVLNSLVNNKVLTSNQARAFTDRANITGDELLAELQQTTGIQGNDFQEQLYNSIGYKTPSTTPDANQTSQAALDRFYNSPGYFNRVNEARRGLETSAATRGSLLSGNAIEGINRGIQDYASNEFNNRLSQLATVSSEAAPLAQANIAASTDLIKTQQQLAQEATTRASKLAGLASIPNPYSRDGIAARGTVLASL